VSALPVLLVAAGAGAVAIRHRLNLTQRASGQVTDVAKCGQLFSLAADWLRAGDAESARTVLNLIGSEGWQFAYDEVVVPSRIPRIAAMADRMSGAALLSTPAAVAQSTDRLAQIETLNAIAAEIRVRIRY
jgi:hypothetical protein